MTNVEIFFSYEIVETSKQVLLTSNSKTSYKLNHKSVHLHCTVHTTRSKSIRQNYHAVWRTIMQNNSSMKSIKFTMFLYTSLSPFPFLKKQLQWAEIKKCYSYAKTCFFLVVVVVFFNRSFIFASSPDQNLIKRVTLHRSPHFTWRKKWNEIT